MLKRLTPGRLVCLALTVLMLVLAFAAYHTDIQETRSENMTVPLHRAGIDPLAADTPAIQTFVAREKDLSALDVMVSNYNRKVKTGTLTLWVTNHQGEEIGRTTVEAAGVKNNAFVSIPLENVQTDSEGKTYTLFATAEGVDQKGITLRAGSIPAPDGTMVLTKADGTADAGNAVYMRLNYTHTVYGIMAGMTLLLLALCFAACIPFAGKERTHG